MIQESELGQLPPKIAVDDDIMLIVSLPENFVVIHNTVMENADCLSQWLPWVALLETSLDTRTFLEEELEKFHAARGVTYAIWYRGEFAGHLSCHAFDWGNRATALGYWLAEKFGGRGMMTRCVKRLIEVLMKDLGLARIEIRCGEGNWRSRAVAERAGLRMEAISLNREVVQGALINWAVYTIVGDGE